jgi:hypothetical protein
MGELLLEHCGNSNIFGGGIFLGIKKDSLSIP